MVRPEPPQKYVDFSMLYENCIGIRRAAWPAYLGGENRSKAIDSIVTKNFTMSAPAMTIAGANFVDKSVRFATAGLFGAGGVIKGTSKDSYLTPRKLNQYKSQITRGKDVHFGTKQEALDFIDKKFSNFKQEVAGSRSAEGWHFDSHSIGGSETAIDYINIYSKSQGFRVHITWGN